MAYGEAIIRGVLINTLGLCAKLLYPLLIFVITRLFGPDLMGHYFIGLAMIELGTAIVTAGWSMAATVYASPYAEAAHEDANAGDLMNETLGRTLVYSLCTALIFGLLVQFGASWLVRTYFGPHTELLPGIYFLGWAMLPTAFTNVIGAASAAHLTMVWEASIGAIRPFFVLVASVIVYFIGGGLTGLLAGYFYSTMVLMFISLIPLVRYYDWRKVLQSMKPVWDKKLFHFAMPHSLMYTLTLYVTRLDTLMLGALGVDASKLAWYATASYLTSNLQQARMVFSTTLAPVVARHHQRHEKQELVELLTKTTRWISTLLPLFALSLVILRRDMLALFDPSYGRSGDMFILVLIIPAVIGATLGLAGNFITYTGHTRVNLLNGILFGVLNTLLNLHWIPKYGLIGAASASALSAAIVGILQVIELYMLERVTIRIRDTWMPYAGAALGAGCIGLIWDPANFGTPQLRVVVATAILVIYGIGLWAAGHPEVRSWIKFDMGFRRTSTEPQATSYEKGAGPDVPP